MAFDNDGVSHRRKEPLSKRTPINQRHITLPSEDLSFLDAPSFNTEMAPALNPFQGHRHHGDRNVDDSMLSIGSNISDADISMILLPHSSSYTATMDHNHHTEGALKEQERTMDASKKEIFELKLKIYHLEERLRRAISPEAEATLVEIAELKKALYAKDKEHLSFVKEIEEMQKKIRELAAARDAALAALDAERTLIQAKLNEDHKAINTQLTRIISENQAEMDKKTAEVSITLKEAEHRRFLLEAELEEALQRTASEGDKIYLLENHLKETTVRIQAQQSKINELNTILTEKEETIVEITSKHQETLSGITAMKFTLQDMEERFQQRLLEKETEINKIKQETQVQLKAMAEELEMTKQALYQSKTESQNLLNVLEKKTAQSSQISSTSLAVANERIIFLESKLSSALSESEMKSVALRQSEKNIQVLIDEQQILNQKHQAISQEYQTLSNEHQKMAQERDQLNKNFTELQEQLKTIKQQNNQECTSLLQGVEEGRASLAAAFELERKRLSEAYSSEISAARIKIEKAESARINAETLVSELSMRLAESELEKKKVAMESVLKKINPISETLDRRQFSSLPAGHHDILHSQTKSSNMKESEFIQSPDNNSLELRHKISYLERQLTDATRALGESARALSERERMREDIHRKNEINQAEILRLKEELHCLREEATKALRIYSRERSNDQHSFKGLSDERDIIIKQYDAVIKEREALLKDRDAMVREKESLIKEINTLRIEIRSFSTESRAKIEAIQVENATLARSKAELEIEKGRLQTGFSTQLTKTMEKLRDTELELLRQRTTIENYERTLAQERERFSVELHNLKLAAVSGGSIDQAMSQSFGNSLMRDSHRLERTGDSVEKSQSKITSMDSEDALAENNKNLIDILAQGLVERLGRTTLYQEPDRFQSKNLLEKETRTSEARNKEFRISETLITEADQRCYAHMQDQLNIARRENIELLDRLRVLDLRQIDQIIQAGKEKVALCTTKEEMQAQLISYQKQLDFYQRELEEMQKKNPNLSHELVEEHSILKDQFKLLKDAHGLLKDQHTLLNNHHDSLKEQHEGLKRLYTETESKLHTAEIQLRDLNEKISVQTRTIKRREALIRKAINRIDALNKKREIMSRQLSLYKGITGLDRTSSHLSHSPTDSRSFLALAQKALHRL